MDCQAMDKSKCDALVIETLGRVKGLIKTKPLLADDREKILALELEAEERSLMGLGKVINSGVREILKSDEIYIGITNMEFDWSAHSSLILKKGEELAGKEIYDEDEISELKKMPNVWFMHRNFVIFKDRISFPSDIMKKICHFETPGIYPEWGRIQSDGQECCVLSFANPSALCDVYLKERYFGQTDERGLGTILIARVRHLSKVDEN